MSIKFLDFFLISCFGCKDSEKNQKNLHFYTYKLRSCGFLVLTSWCGSFRKRATRG